MTKRKAGDRPAIMALIADVRAAPEAPPKNLKIFLAMDRQCPWLPFILGENRKIMSIYNGKIGRWPKELRNQANRRVEGGKASGTVVECLNDLAAVQSLRTEDLRASPSRARGVESRRANTSQQETR